METLLEYIVVFALTVLVLEGIHLSLGSPLTGWWKSTRVHKALVRWIAYCIDWCWDKFMGSNDNN